MGEIGARSGLWAIPSDPHTCARQKSLTEKLKIDNVSQRITEENDIYSLGFWILLPLCKCKKNIFNLIALASHYFAACVFCPQMLRCGQLWSLFMFSQHIVSSCWGIVWWLQRSAWFDLLCSLVHPSWGFTFVKRCVGSSEAISHELNISQNNLMNSIKTKIDCALVKRAYYFMHILIH